MKTKKAILLFALSVIAVGVFAQMDTSKRSHKTNGTYTTTPRSHSSKSDTMKTHKSMHSKSYKTKRDSTK